jgi:UDP-N-acetylmuramate: L-alanyl-gamma-D-glutamyl-meso-diaminopimelate ligase
MHLHILGICGTFMGGIAAIAQRAGHIVTGCDSNVYPPMSSQLEALGIALTQGFEASQLDGPAKAADVFVVGNVVSRGNPLLEAILDRGLRYTSGPQWLAEQVLRTSGCSLSPGRTARRRLRRCLRTLSIALASSRAS